MFQGNGPHRSSHDARCGPFLLAESKGRSSASFANWDIAQGGFETPSVRIPALQRRGDMQITESTEKKLRPNPDAAMLALVLTSAWSTRGQRAMQVYRVYCLDGADRFLRTENIEAPTDERSRSACPYSVRRCAQV